MPGLEGSRLGQQAPECLSVAAPVRQEAQIVEGPQPEQARGVVRQPVRRIEGGGLPEPRFARGGLIEPVQMILAERKGELGIAGIGRQPLFEEADGGRGLSRVAPEDIGADLIGLDVGRRRPAGGPDPGQQLNEIGFVQVPVLLDMDAAVEPRPGIAPFPGSLHRVRPVRSVPPVRSARHATLMRVHACAVVGLRAAVEGGIDLFQQRQAHHVPGIAQDDLQDIRAAGPRPDRLHPRRQRPRQQRHQGHLDDQRERMPPGVHGCGYN